MFFKIKQTLWENMPMQAVFKCPAAKLYKIVFLSHAYYALEFSS